VYAYKHAFDQFRLLWTLQWNFTFYKKREVLWPATRLSIYKLNVGRDVTHEFDHDGDREVYKSRKSLHRTRATLKNTPPFEKDINKAHAETFLNILYRNDHLSLKWYTLFWHIRHWRQKNGDMTTVSPVKDKLPSKPRKTTQGGMTVACTANETLLTGRLLS
jgi:hypothetical protein